MDIEGLTTAAQLKALLTERVRIQQHWQNQLARLHLEGVYFAKGPFLTTCSKAPEISFVGFEAAIFR
jgi:hypothetical protein